MNSVPLIEFYCKYRKHPGYGQLQPTQIVGIKSLVDISSDVLGDVVEKQNHIQTDFCSGWDVFSDRASLNEFSSGHTVFPEAETIESVFFILGWKKNYRRTSLSGPSLEGILHAKQLDKLKIWNK